MNQTELQAKQQEIRTRWNEEVMAFSRSLGHHLFIPDPTTPAGDRDWLHQEHANKLADLFNELMDNIDELDPCPEIRVRETMPESVTRALRHDVEVLDRELARILGGQDHYGTVEIELHNQGVDGFGNRYFWVGNPGVTASVGQAIRYVTKLIEGGNPLTLPVWRIASPVGEGCDVYYQFRLKDWLDRASKIEGPDMVFTVGGCTDFSGEGNRGRELMERWVRNNGWPVDERGADVLVDELAMLQR